MFSSRKYPPSAPPPPPTPPHGRQSCFGPPTPLEFSFQGVLVIGNKKKISHPDNGARENTWGLRWLLQPRPSPGDKVVPSADVVKCWVTHRFIQAHR